MSPLALFALCGVATLAIRGWAVVAVSLGLEVSPAVAETLKLVGPAVLSAIAANALLIDDGSISTNWAWYLAAVIAAAGWLKWRSGGVAFAIGFAAVSVLNQIL